MEHPMHPLPIPPPNPKGNFLNNNITPQPNVDYIPLQSAGKLISQNLSADEKYPELYDQLMDNEPHNYFFEPYQSLWKPQTIIQGRIKYLPPALLSEYQLLECISLMGLFPEINRAWMSIDNKLFLWNYTEKEQFYVYDGLDQVIVCVGLVAPKPGIFREFVKHILVIATPVEVILMAVVFDNNDEVNGDLTLRTTQFAIPTDNVNMVKILGLDNGRIFMAGKDGCLYEIVYDTSESLYSYLGFGKKCKKVNHSFSYKDIVIPTFLRNVANGQSTLKDILIDHERKILYTLSSTSVIKVYYLGSGSDTILPVTQKNAIDEAHAFCTRNQRGNPSIPDGRMFANRNSSSIVSIAIVSPEESNIIHLLAITCTGIRLYFSTTNVHSYHGAPLRSEPYCSTLELVHVRLPPPSVEPNHLQQNEGLQPGFVAERSCSNIHTVFYNEGNMLFVDSPIDHHDRIIAINRDLLQRSRNIIPTPSLKPVLRESVNQIKIEGKVWQIQKEEHKGHKQKKISSELLKQLTQPIAKYLCLTNIGIYTFLKLSPIHQLGEILNKEDISTNELLTFVKNFGNIQTCCMLFGIACGVTKSSSLPFHRSNLVMKQAVEVIFTYGGEAGATTDGRLDGRLVMSDDIYFSYHHDGLALFLARMLSPIWESSVSCDTSYVALLHNLREPLFQLQQLMESIAPYTIAIQQDQHEATFSTNKQAILGNSTIRVLTQYATQQQKDQSKRANALKQEQYSLQCIYKLLVRCVQGFSLLIILLESSSTSSSFFKSQPGFEKQTFCDMITTSSGLSLIRCVIQRVMEDLRKEAGKVEILATTLRRQCPLFFTAADMLQYQGYDLLMQAKSTPNLRERFEILEETLAQFLHASRFWQDASYVQVLKTISKEYVQLNFYSGVVDLALSCADNYAQHNDMESCQLACYECIFDVLELLLEKSSGENKIGTNMFVALNVLSPELRENHAQATLERALASKDVLFHSTLYSWLYDRLYTNILIEIRSSYIEEFLKGKDIELLCNYLVKQLRYADAMLLLNHLASETNKDLFANPQLSQRIKYFTRAIQCAQTASVPGSVEKSTLSNLSTSINRLQENLDIATLQMRVLIKLQLETKSLSERDDKSNTDFEQRKEHIDLLEYELFDISTLYNRFANPYKMWEICLAIVHTCKHEDTNLILRLWKKIIYQVVPFSSRHPSVDMWLRQQHNDADISEHEVLSMQSIVFENDSWMRNLRAKIISLGKEFFFTGANFTFPIKFIHRELETLLMKFNECHIEKEDRENWLLTMFKEIGIPFSLLFDTYKSFYQEQGSSGSMVHALNSICSLVEIWRQQAVQCHSTESDKIEFIHSIPMLFREFEAFITDIQATGEGWKTDDKSNCLQRIRSLKKQLESV